MEIIAATPYAFSTLVPARFTDAAKFQQYRDDCIAALIKAAIEASIASAPDGLTIRPILPNTDLGVTNESWLTPTLTANAWVQYISQALSTPYAVGFFGVFNRASSPLVSGIRYRQGAGGAGSTKLIVTLEQLIAMDENVGFHPPVVYKPGNTVYVDAYGLTGVTTQLLGFFGFVAEPRGKNMTGGVI